MCGRGWSGVAAPALLPHVALLLAVGCPLQNVAYTEELSFWLGYEYDDPIEVWSPALCQERLLNQSILIRIWSRLTFGNAVGGATLATAARLKWDPSTYAPLRELFPKEYRVTAGWLAAAGVALVLQGHLVAAALLVRRATLRRSLLIAFQYSALMATLLGGEVLYAVWVWRSVHAWLLSEHARALHDALALREHLDPLLEALGRWHPLPAKVKDLILEAEADAPRNGYVAAAACVLLLTLQVAGLVLALLAATRHPETSTPLAPAHRSSSDKERTPLKAEFRNGRLVVL